LGEDLGPRAFVAAGSPRQHAQGFHGLNEFLAESVGEKIDDDEENDDPTIAPKAAAVRRLMSNRWRG